MSLAACTHPAYDSRVDVVKLGVNYRAVVRVWCTVCGRPFLFRRIPAGLMEQATAVSRAAFQEVCVPMEPAPPAEEEDIQ